MKQILFITILFLVSCSKPEPEHESIWICDCKQQSIVDQWLEDNWTDIPDSQLEEIAVKSNCVQRFEPSFYASDFMGVSVIKTDTCQFLYFFK